MGSGFCWMGEGCSSSSSPLSLGECWLCSESSAAASATDRSGACADVGARMGNVAARSKAAYDRGLTWPSGCGSGSTPMKSTPLLALTNDDEAVEQYSSYGRASPSSDTKCAKSCCSLCSASSPDSAIDLPYMPNK